MPDGDLFGEQEDGSMASQDSLSELAATSTDAEPRTPSPRTPVVETEDDDVPAIPHFHAAHEYMADMFDPSPPNFILENFPPYPAFFIPPPQATYLSDEPHPPTFTPLATITGSPTTVDSVPFITFGADSSDEEDDIVQSTNDVVFDNDVLSQEMERYNSDFAGFCGQLWNQRTMPPIRERYSNCTNPPPHISHEGAKIVEWARTRPQEITHEDVERGEDMQGIQWRKLELSKKAARKWRQARYMNYRNLEVFVKERLVGSLHVDPLCIVMLINLGTASHQIHQRVLFVSPT